MYARALVGNASVTCEVCVDPTLQPFYPEWRRQVALSVLIIHVMLTLLCILLVWIYREPFLKQGRDPHLLLLLAVGAVFTCHTAIREYVGEANYPCLAHLISTHISTSFMIVSVCVRQFRLAVLHRQQLRLSQLMRGKQQQLDEMEPCPTVMSETSQLSPTFTLESPPLRRAQAGEASDDVDPDAGDPGTPSVVKLRLPPHILQQQQQVISDKNAFSKQNQEGKVVGDVDGVHKDVVVIAVTSGNPPPHNGTTTVDITDKHNKAPDSIPVRRSICAALCTEQGIDALLLDRLALHRPLRQLFLWLFLDCLMAITPVYRAIVAPHQFTLQATGCNYIYVDNMQATAWAVVMIMLQLGTYCYVRRHPDAFMLSREVAYLITVGIIALLAIILIRFINANAVLKVFPPNYLGMAAGWCVFIISFLVPIAGIIRGDWQSPNTWNNAKRDSSIFQAGSSRGPTRVWPAEILHNARDQASADPIENKQLPKDVVSKESTSALTPSPAGSGIWNQHDLEDISSNVFCKMLNQGAAPTASSLQVQLQEILDGKLSNASSRLLTDGEWELLAAYMCCNSIGRRYLKQYLAKEWSVELLLFLLDVAFLRGKCDLASYHGTRAAARMASPRRTSSREGTKLLSKATSSAEDACAVAHSLFSNYIATSAVMPVNISASAATRIQRAAEALRLGLKQQSVDRGLLSLLSELSGACDAAGRDVFRMLTYGPLMRFTATPAFQQFLREHSRHRQSHEAACIALDR